MGLETAPSFRKLPSLNPQKCLRLGPQCVFQERIYLLYMAEPKFTHILSMLIIFNSFCFVIDKKMRFSHLECFLTHFILFKLLVHH